MKRWHLLAACAVLLPLPAAAQEAVEAVEIGATYITDVLSVVDGGARRGTMLLGRADVTIEVKGEAVGLPGVVFFVDVLAVQKSGFSDRFVGDGQVVSNVEADSAVRPIEAWLAVPFGGGVTAKAGLIDLNTEFDVQSVGAMFLNSSHGIGPDFSQSGVNGPSIFPAAASAAMLRLERDGWKARLGAFDGIAGSRANPRRAALRVPGTTGALIVGEVDRTLGRAKLQLGAWRYTARFDSVDATRSGKRPSHGAYALAEATLLARGESKLDFWFRVGAASADANPIGLYLGGGVAWGHDRARLGLAIAHARLGEPALRGTSSDRAETAIELTYSHRLAPGVIVQPDLQYVINPGWEPTRRDALVAGVRFRFAWPRD